MALISKYDKKIWDKYISNFEKSVLIPSRKNSDNTENHALKRNLHKINKLRDDAFYLGKRV